MAVTTTTTSTPTSTLTAAPTTQATPPGRARPRRWARRGLGFATVALAAAGLLKWLPGCELATSFRGDGYSRDGGVTLPDAGDTVVVGLTNAGLDPDNRRDFDDYTQRVVASLPGTPGYIGHAVRTRVFGHEVWTMTVWKDEAALDAFVRSPTHREAIRKGMPAVKWAKFHRFTLAKDQVPPSWADVKARLASVAAKDYGSSSSGVSAGARP